MRSYSAKPGPSLKKHPVGIKMSDAPANDTFRTESITARTERSTAIQMDSVEANLILHELSSYGMEESTENGVTSALHDIGGVTSANIQSRNSAEFFRAIVDAVIEPLVVLSADLRVVMANEPFLNCFTVSSEAIVNKFFYNLANGQWDIPQLRTLLEEILPKRRNVRGFIVEYEVAHIGSRILLLNAHALSSVSGAEPMILVAIEDITERREAESALRESEERFRTLFDLGPVAVYYCDTSGLILNYNHHAAKLWGRAPQLENVDERFSGALKMFNPDGSFIPHDQSPMASVVHGKIQEVCDQEVLIERPDGSRITVIINIRRLKNGHGDFVGAISGFYDISERKKTEFATSRLAAIIESSDDAIVGKNLNGIVETWNKGAERLFGYSSEEAIGQPITIIIPSDRLNEEPVILERIGRGEHIDHYESVRRHKDGRLLDVSLTISPIIDAHGRIVGASKIARDITERKMAEAALIKSEKLAAAGRLAATLAHEINNPLQAVTNLITLLRSSSRLDEQEQTYAAMAEAELGRIIHLTQQSLSFHRESIYPVEVNLDAVIDGVLDLYAERLHSRRIIVTRRYLSGGTTINSFPGEIRQVLSTLLLNAMDALPSGGTISVRVRKAFDWQCPPCSGVRITFADNGAGVPAHNASRIFEPFFTTKGEKGTGLSLWVANGIINRLGGTIRMRSSVLSEESGTCFLIFLPIRLPANGLASRRKGDDFIAKIL
jgi:PAS domain S-box-containing protein